MRLLLAAGMGVTIAITALVGLGCKNTDTSFGAPPSCTATDGKICKPTNTGGGSSGSGGASSSSSGAGGGVSGSLVGDVGLITTETFDTLTPFNGKATILGDKVGGGQVQADYTGSMTGFDLEGLVNGERWFFVQDPTMGGAGIFSTYSPATVPGVAVHLPVIETVMMNKIAAPLSSVHTFNSADAQIILLVQHNGKPFTGLSVQGAGPGGVIAYDTGPGSFSEGTATGSAGIILILNTPPGAQGKATITLVDATATTYPLGQIPVSAGAATFYPLGL